MIDNASERTTTVTNTEPDAPETDTGDRGGEYQGEWLRRAPTGPPHRCDTPTTYSENRRMYLADASAGDVWRCGCGRLWVCRAEAGGTSAPTWRRAGLWLRLRYAPLWGRQPAYVWVVAAVVTFGMGTLAVLSLLGLAPSGM